MAKSLKRVQVEMLFWYSDEDTEGDYPSLAGKGPEREAIDELTQLEMLVTQSAYARNYKSYKLTSKGQFFIDHILDLPWPEVQEKYYIPVCTPLESFSLDDLKEKTP